MPSFYNTNPKEQETVINVDYYKREVICYTNRKVQIEKLIKKLGEPTKFDYVNKKISGAFWHIPFDNKTALRIIFSRPNLIGSL